MEDFSNQNNPPSTPTGQTLGGGSVESLTPAEIRQRRLESLERQQQQTQQVDQQRQLLVEQQGQARLQASNVNIKTLSPDSKFPQAPQQQQQPAPSHHQPQQRPDPPPQQHQQQQAPTFPPAIVNDDEDEDLQAALALSLGDAATVDTVSESQNEDDDDAEDTPEHQLAAALRLSMEQDDPAQESSPSPPPTIPLFVQTQFAPHIQHSLETAEPTSILDFHYIMWDTTTTVHDQRRWLSQGIYFQNPHGTFRTDNLLASIISNHEVWGLTQTHGGPCGVLAAVQAELLRLLIFGPRRRNGLEYPTSLNHELAAMATDLSPQLLEEGLAKSISILLARASITPAANLHDPNNSGSGDNNHTNTTTTDYMTSHSNTHPTVQLVLPKENTNGLEWCHMEPWTSENGGSGMSEHLVTYTISAPPSTTTITNASSTPLKRPKIFAASDCGIEELAYATAQFLLETRAIDIFQRPGGILLMVMSLALSRRIPNVQGDMDDFTSKLTSNFGHCSQELINLLLTGQAVSNVFDHTLRPSGELICRGIQSRPAIGYLSQLESMRYLEVGGYFKTPQFPIWVVGSTSHFTVMFGDASCLQESESDIILEKCRRAFKTMEGGAEENGFIQVSQLSEFLEKLDLNFPSHSVQMLGATMEVHGAGIMLWEDLWKRVSRLLTGATLETVLGGEENTISEVQIVPAPTAAAAFTSTDPNAPISDEELARRLHAEWNGESLEPTPIQTNTSMVVSSPPAPAPAAPAVKPETYGQTYQLYHYNGLRGTFFKAFRITRLSADEAIGASVSLGASSHSNAIMGNSGDLESVLRTKWPSCKINWLEGSPPSID